MTANIIIIRPLNLLIILVTMYIFKLGLINLFIQNPALNNFNYFLFVSATILITAAGYIINDIYDVKTDSVNDKKLIIGKNISKKSALNWYYILNLLSIIIIVYVSYFIGKITLALIFILTIIMLWFYSKSLKSTFLLGNLLVSGIIALSITNIYFFDILPVYNLNPSSGIILKIIIVFSLFAFITNLKREIIKDVIDINGDRSIDANTLPIKLGVKSTKKIIIFLNTVLILIISFWQYFQYSVNKTFFDLSSFGEDINQIVIWGTDSFSIFYVFSIQILLFIFLFLCLSANIKKDYIKLSQIAKIIMMIGILAIPIFSISYFI
jgi:4-hydroxybenzoate polyprenyltransferase|tara:strand:- start:72 stop:1043 length:972 start_codon:yes stop_codon:yes gene_type:complete